MLIINHACETLIDSEEISSQRGGSEYITPHTRLRLEGLLLFPLLSAGMPPPALVE